MTALRQDLAHAVKKQHLPLHACCRLPHSNAVEGVWSSHNPHPATLTSAKGDVQQRVHAATGMTLPHWVAVQFVLAGEQTGSGATVCAFRAGRWPGVQLKEKAAAGVTQPYRLAGSVGWPSSILEGALPRVLQIGQAASSQGSCSGQHRSSRQRPVAANMGDCSGINDQTIPQGGLHHERTNGPAAGGVSRQQAAGQGHALHIRRGAAASGQSSSGKVSSTGAMLSTASTEEGTAALLVRQQSPQAKTLAGAKAEGSPLYITARVCAGHRLPCRLTCGRSPCQARSEC